MSRLAASIRFLSVLACAVPLCAGLAAAETLSDSERLGRELFMTGRIGGSAPTALAGPGNVSVGAAAVPCASCHGRDGRGRPEGGIVPPDITWASLSRPSTTPERSRGAYDDIGLIRAIAMGIGANGARLDPVMPRFQLSQADAAALLAWLHRLGDVPEPGLDDRTIVLAVGPPAGTPLTSYIDTINLQGGIFGRRLEARMSESAAGDSVFATIAADIAGHESETIAAASEAGTPLIGPVTQRTRAAPPNRYVFYLNGGIEAEARGLTQYAAATWGPPVVVDDGTEPLHAGAMEAARVSPGVSSLHTNDLAAAVAVLWFSGRGLPNDPSPHWLIPGMLAAHLPAGGPPSNVIAAFPSGPPDLMPWAWTGTGATPAEIQARAAAVVLVEGLRRAGRDLTRERLVDALETLRNFRTGLVPPVTFSASRHVGSTGVWIVPLNGGPPVWWDK